jgi:hypothetical protein
MRVAKSTLGLTAFREPQPLNSQKNRFLCNKIAKNFLEEVKVLFNGKMLVNERSMFSW